MNLPVGVNQRILFMPTQGSHRSKKNSGISIMVQENYRINRKLGLVCVIGGLIHKLWRSF